MNYVESYIIIWSGIFTGMMLASLFYGMVWQMLTRRWMIALTLIWLVCAFLTRPFIMSMVTP